MKSNSLPCFLKPSFICLCACMLEDGKSTLPILPFFFCLLFRGEMLFIELFNWSELDMESCGCQLVSCLSCLLLSRVDYQPRANCCSPFSRSCGLHPNHTHFWWYLGPLPVPVFIKGSLFTRTLRDLSSPWLLGLPLLVGAGCLAPWQWKGTPIPTLATPNWLSQEKWLEERSHCTSPPKQSKLTGFAACCQVTVAKGHWDCCSLTPPSSLVF